MELDITLFEGLMEDPNMFASIMCEGILDEALDPERAKELHTNISLKGDINKLRELRNKELELGKKAVDYKRLADKAKRDGKDAEYKKYMELGAKTAEEGERISRKIKEFNNVGDKRYIDD